MKILFLARRFYPDIGGVEKHAHEIGKILIDKGHDITVVTQSSGKVKTVDGIKIVRIPKMSKNSSEKFHVWKWFWKNKELMKDADVVHAHDVYWWYWPYRMLFLSKKSFITFHGYESYPVKKSAIISRRVSALLSNGSIAVGDFIKKWYGTKSNYITYGGITGDRTIKPIAKKNTAIFIGRLDKDTGILEYLEVESRLNSKINDFNLKVVGDGKYRDRISNNNRVGFTSDYRKLLGESEMVFSSSYLMMLEALSMGKPIFSIYSNDLKKDYLIDSPFRKFIFVTKSADDLVVQIENYLKDRNMYIKRLQEGQSWARRQTWSSLSNTYIKLWQEQK